MPQTLSQTPLLSQPNATGKPDILISAVLHLMSHYSRNAQQQDEHRACVRLAAVIERHLTVLSELPGLTPVMHATCQQLAEHWSDLIDQDLSQAPKPRKSGWRVRFSS